MEPDIPNRQEGAEILLRVIADHREDLLKWREVLPAHATFRPDFENHQRRLDEIETLLKRDADLDFTKAVDLYDDLELDLLADKATARADVEARLVRFWDELDARFEKRKFEMSSETRDELEDLIVPYRDKFRDELVENLPIETRIELDEGRRKPGGSPDE